MITVAVRDAILALSCLGRKDDSSAAGDLGLTEDFLS